MTSAAKTGMVSSIRDTCDSIRGKVSGPDGNGRYLWRVCDMSRKSRNLDWGRETELGSAIDSCHKSAQKFQIRKIVREYYNTVDWI